MKTNYKVEKYNNRAVNQEWLEYYLEQGFSLRSSALLASLSEEEVEKILGIGFDIRNLEVVE